jgi:hypothetical protein
LQATENIVEIVEYSLLPAFFVFAATEQASSGFPPALGMNPFSAVRAFEWCLFPFEAGGHQQPVIAEFAVDITIGVVGIRLDAPNEKNNERELNQSKR